MTRSRVYELTRARQHNKKLREQLVDANKVILFSWQTPKLCGHQTDCVCAQNLAKAYLTTYPSKVRAKPVSVSEPLWWVDIREALWAQQEDFTEVTGAQLYGEGSTTWAPLTYGLRSNEQHLFRFLQPRFKFGHNLVITTRKRSHCWDKHNVYTCERFSVDTPIYPR